MSERDDDRPADTDDDQPDDPRASDGEVSATDDEVTEPADGGATPAEKQEEVRAAMSEFVMSEKQRERLVKAAGIDKIIEKVHTAAARGLDASLKKSGRNPFNPPGESERLKALSDLTHRSIEPSPTAAQVEQLTAVNREQVSELVEIKGHQEAAAKDAKKALHIAQSSFILSVLVGLATIAIGVLTLGR